MLPSSTQIYQYAETIAAVLIKLEMNIPTIILILELLIFFRISYDIGKVILNSYVHPVEVDTVTIPIKLAINALSVILFLEVFVFFWINYDIGKVIANAYGHPIEVDGVFVTVVCHFIEVAVVCMAVLRSVKEWQEKQAEEREREAEDRRKYEVWRQKMRVRGFSVRSYDSWVDLVNKAG
ncbi:hypothetical protein DM02DRAFT_692497 [Periconia macrospinosa]|uniref:Uncharacterized protein n=1 Tax=Periconia macrospinosa TaxID=97972 RepID=A0A2V1D9J1_9PLEO|nr:hypothetical protein DM02DRAFT_692497 [Periconia macrospinosa]